MKTPVFHHDAGSPRADACGRLTVRLMSTMLLVLMYSYAGAQARSSAPKADGKNGKRIYDSYGCYECHGGEGQGSTLSGPRIGPNPIPLPAFIKYIRQPTGQMPPYTSKIMSDAELAEVHAFLQSLPKPPDPKGIRILNAEPGAEKGK